MIFIKVLHCRNDAIRVLRRERGRREAGRGRREEVGGKREEGRGRREEGRGQGVRREREGEMCDDYES